MLKKKPAIISEKWRKALTHAQHSKKSYLLGMCDRFNETLRELSASLITSAKEDECLEHLRSHLNEIPFFQDLWNFQINSEYMATTSKAGGEKSNLSQATTHQAQRLIQPSHLLNDESDNDDSSGGKQQGLSSLPLESLAQPAVIQRQKKQRKQENSLMRQLGCVWYEKDAYVYKQKDTTTSAMCFYVVWFGEVEETVIDEDAQSQQQAQSAVRPPSAASAQNVLLNSESHGQQAGKSQHKQQSNCGQQNQTVRCRRRKKPGDFFGEKELLNKSLRYASVRCVEETCLLYFTEQAFWMQGIDSYVIDSNPILGGLVSGQNRVRKNIFTKYLPPVDVMYLAYQQESIVYSFGGYVFKEGDAFDSLYTLGSGKVRFSKVIQADIDSLENARVKRPQKDFSLGFMTSPETFGEESLLEEMRKKKEKIHRNFSAIVDSDKAIIHRISVSDFLSKMITRHDEYAYRLLRPFVLAKSNLRQNQVHQQEENKYLCENLTPKSTNRLACSPNSASAGANGTTNTCFKHRKIVDTGHNNSNAGVSSFGAVATTTTDKKPATIDNDLSRAMCHHIKCEFYEKDESLHTKSKSFSPMARKATSVSPQRKRIGLFDDNDEDDIMYQEGSSPSPRRCLVSRRQVRTIDAQLDSTAANQTTSALVAGRPTSQQQQKWTRIRSVSRDVTVSTQKLCVVSPLSSAQLGINYSAQRCKTAQSEFHGSSEQQQQLQQSSEESQNSDINLNLGMGEIRLITDYDAYAKSSEYVDSLIKKRLAEGVASREGAQQPAKNMNKYKEKSSNPMMLGWKSQESKKFCKAMMDLSCQREDLRLNRAKHKKSRNEQSSERSWAQGDQTQDHVLALYYQKQHYKKEMVAEAELSGDNYQTEQQKKYVPLRSIGSFVNFFRSNSKAKQWLKSPMKKGNTGGHVSEDITTAATSRGGSVQQQTRSNKNNHTSQQPPEDFWIKVNSFSTQVMKALNTQQLSPHEAGLQEMSKTTGFTKSMQVEMIRNTTAPNQIFLTPQLRKWNQNHPQLNESSKKSTIYSTDSPNIIRKPKVVANNNQSAASPQPHSINNKNFTFTDVIQGQGILENNMSSPIKRNRSMNYSQTAVMNHTNNPLMITPDKPNTQQQQQTTALTRRPNTSQSSTTRKRTLTTNSEL